MPRLEEDEEIFRGEHSRVLLYDPDFRKLIITFDHYNKEKQGFVRSQHSRLFQSKEFANLRIQTARNDWFVNPDLPLLEQLLPAVVRPFQRIVALGYSLGGYGALRLARTLRVQQVLVISPQVSLAPERAPWERRFRREAAGFDAQLGDMVPHAMPELTGTVIFDPVNRADAAHAAAIQILFPGLEMAPLSFAGHPASRVLAQVGEGDFLRQCTMDPALRARDVVAVHRAARRLSPIYWTGFANAVRKRWPDAADRAEREALITEAWLREERQRRRDAHQQEHGPGEVPDRPVAP